jgi:predicted RNase H-like HicB family nuclease
MSTDTPDKGSTSEPPESRNIALSWDDETEQWSAVDEDLGVASQGETREEALDNLDEAVALYTGEAGESIDTWEEERKVLKDLDIDPDEVNEAREGDAELPDFMR